MCETCKKFADCALKELFGKNPDLCSGYEKDNK